MSGAVGNNKAIQRWLPALGWMALIFALSSVPEPPGPPDPWWRWVFMKSAHLGAYAILAILLERALALPRRGMALALLLTVLYAASDEFHQTFVPGRHGSFTDIVIDLAGGALGLAALSMLRRRYWRKSSKLT